MQEAKGSFEVTMTPESQDSATGIDRMALEKTLSGDFVGQGVGTMVSCLGEPKTSGSYVAIERLTGTLEGRSGSFVLVHKASMSAAGETQDITIVPDTGTDQLTGISGDFEIIRHDGAHSYVLRYTLP